MFDESTGKTVGGNYGLMDQQLALKYVHENAGNMGGDPSKITINGESAGGMSVALQLLNPTSASYVNAAIAQSGSTMNAFIFQYLQDYQKNNNWHDLCGKLAGCQAKSNFQNTLAEAEAYLEAMKDASARDIWNAAKNTFIPIVGPIPTDGIFFTSDPRDRIRANNVPTNIPYYITTNSYEGSLLKEEEYGYENGKFTFAEFAMRLPYDLPINDYKETWLEYYNTEGGTNVTEPMTYDQRFALGSYMYGDLYFRQPAADEANAYANAGADVYKLYFDMDDVLDLAFMEISCCGVPHFGEMLYTMFGVDPYTAREWEVTLTDYMLNHYSVIVNTGNAFT